MFLLDNLFCAMYYVRDIGDEFINETYTVSSFMKLNY